jgi:hypothetical protein
MVPQLSKNKPGLSYEEPLGVLNKGQIIDFSFTIAPRQHNTHEIAKATKNIGLIISNPQFIQV